MKHAIAQQQPSQHSINLTRSTNYFRQGIFISVAFLRALRQNTVLCFLQKYLQIVFICFSSKVVGNYVAISIFCKTTNVWRDGEVLQFRSSTEKEVSARVVTWRYRLCNGRQNVLVCRERDKESKWYKPQTNRKEAKNLKNKNDLNKNSV